MDLLTDPCWRIGDPPSAAHAPSVSNAAARGAARRINFRPGRSRRRNTHEYPEKRGLITVTRYPARRSRHSRVNSRATNRREGHSARGGSPDKSRPVPNRGANRRGTIAQTRPATRVPVTARKRPSCSTRAPFPTRAIGHARDASRTRPRSTIGSVDRGGASSTLFLTVVRATRVSSIAPSPVLSGTTSSERDETRRGAN